MPSGNANKFLRAHQGHQLSSSQPCREKSHHVLTSISSLAVHTGVMATLPCTFYILVNVRHAYKIKDKTPKLTSWRWHIAYLLFLNTMWVAGLYFCFDVLFNMLLLLHFCLTSSHSNMVTPAVVMMSFDTQCVWYLLSYYSKVLNNNIKNRCLVLLYTFSCHLRSHHRPFCVSSSFPLCLK